MSHDHRPFGTVLTAMITPFAKDGSVDVEGAGKLAEITLENILKASGLKNGLDFSMQYNLSGEHNNKLRPDAVIFLPSNNIMIIDAKASKFLIDECDSGIIDKVMDKIDNIAKFNKDNI